eukprot:Blabericola_migrator_1__1523@NODE_13_length_24280_cov_225_960393_g10_i0_p2_GENE_NODE_13_length_24280_cov_225_960393_g10_i0NODE_13_length_24280_cov_225_960393_g10_i0_p2_ORF_typecomplete_len1519_score168_97PGAP1/PF07819_13/4_1e13Abhydrolase_6/PF12697_7/0_00085Hydrolase_4/PF12146_8/2e03Hydrolase_4/PF12146_8/0_013DUF2048/PF09752_9/0_073DUF2048/PF09752_9/2e03Abhydrolase_5/PF12695_7/5_2e03Abhydrolase_5/PF12695_7/0_077Abhydrolase_2/PF02230_16/0_06DUF2974/PF11187_8/0_12Abhydrolase_1/PF00561_20/2_5e03Abh
MVRACVLILFIGVATCLLIGDKRPSDGDSTVPVLFLHGHAGAASDLAGWKGALYTSELSRNEFSTALSISLNSEIANDGPSLSNWTYTDAAAGPIYNFDFQGQFSATNIQIFLDQAALVRSALKRIAANEADVWESGESNSLTDILNERKTLVICGFSMGGVVAQHVFAEYLVDAVHHGCLFNSTGPIRRPSGCDAAFLTKWPLDIGLLVTVSSPIRSPPFSLGLGWDAVYAFTQKRLREAMKSIQVRWKLAFPPMVSFCGGQMDQLVSCAETDMRDIITDDALINVAPALDALPSSVDTDSEGHTAVMRNHDFLYKYVTPFVLYYARMYELATIEESTSATPTTADIQSIMYSTFFILAQLDIAIPGTVYSSNLRYLVSDHLQACDIETPADMIGALLNMGRHLLSSPDVLERTKLGPVVRDNLMHDMVAGLTHSLDYLRLSIDYSANWTSQLTKTAPHPSNPTTSPPDETSTCGEVNHINLSNVKVITDNDSKTIKSLDPSQPLLITMTSDAVSDTRMYTVEILQDIDITSLPIYLINGTRIYARVPTWSFPMNHTMIGGQNMLYRFHFGVIDATDLVGEPSANVRLGVVPLKASSKALISIRAIDPGTNLQGSGHTQSLSSWGRIERRDYVITTDAKMALRQNTTETVRRERSVVSKLQTSAQYATDLLLLYTNQGRLLMPVQVDCTWAVEASSQDNMFRTCAHHFRPRHLNITPEEWTVLSLHATQPWNPVFLDDLDLQIVTISSITGITSDAKVAEIFIAMLSAHVLVFNSLASAYLICLSGYHFILRGLAQTPGLHQMMIQIRYVPSYRLCNSIGAFLRLIVDTFLPKYHHSSFKKQIFPALMFNVVWTIYVALLQKVPIRTRVEERSGDLFQDLDWYFVTFVIWACSIGLTILWCSLMAYFSCFYLLCRRVPWTVRRFWAWLKRQRIRRRHEQQIASDVQQRSPTREPSIQLRVSDTRFGQGPVYAEECGRLKEGFVSPPSLHGECGKRTESTTTHVNVIENPQPLVSTSARRSTRQDRARVGWPLIPKQWQLHMASFSQRCRVKLITRLVLLISVYLLLPSMLPVLALLASLCLCAKACLHIPVRGAHRLARRTPSHLLASAPHMQGETLVSTVEAVTSKLAWEEEQQYQAIIYLYRLRSATYLVISCLLTHQCLLSMFYTLSQVQEVFTAGKAFLIVGAYKTSLGLLLRSDHPSSAGYIFAIIYDLYLTPLIPLTLIWILVKRFNKRQGFLPVSSTESTDDEGEDRFSNVLYRDSTASSDMPLSERLNSLCAPYDPLLFPSVSEDEIFKNDPSSLPPEEKLFSSHALQGEEENLLSVSQLFPIEDGGALPALPHLSPEMIEKVLKTSCQLDDIADTSGLNSHGKTSLSHDANITPRNVNSTVRENSVLGGLYQSAKSNPDPRQTTARGTLATGNNNLSQITTPTLEYLRQRRQISCENFIIPNYQTSRRDATLHLITGLVFVAIGTLGPILTRLVWMSFNVFPVLMALLVCLIHEGFLLYQSTQHPFLV